MMYSEYLLLGVAKKILEQPRTYSTSLLVVLAHVYSKRMGSIGWEDLGAFVAYPMTIDLRVALPLRLGSIRVCIFARLPHVRKLSDKGNSAG